MNRIKKTRGTTKNVEAFVKLQCEENGCEIRKKKEQEWTNGQIERLHI